MHMLSKRGKSISVEAEPVKVPLLCYKNFFRGD